MLKEFNRKTFIKRREMNAYAYIQSKISYLKYKTQRKTEERSLQMVSWVESLQKIFFPFTTIFSVQFQKSKNPKIPKNFSLLPEKALSHRICGKKFQNVLSHSASAPGIAGVSSRGRGVIDWFSLPSFVFKL